MKKLCLLAVLVFVGLNGCSKAPAPKAVMEAFEAKFANAQNVKWEMEEQNKWEADFALDGKEFSVCFDGSGQWLETEQEMTKEDLPDTVLQILSAQFQDFEIEEVESVETPETKGYELGIETGGKAIEVFVDESGKLTIKEEKADDDADEDEDADAAADEENSDETNENEGDPGEN
ncbi:PepSY-like domain-containing protein [candidate division KSB1 bacterium]|nr:PepSY-like domain-containing protein [candidate division KSB1 bacterium]